MIELLDDDPKPAAAPAPFASPEVLAAAGAVDAAPAPGEAAAAPAAPPAAAPPVDPTAEARDLIEFAAGLFFPISPSLERVYTPEVRARLAEKGAPVLKKYGLNLSAIFGRWDAEIGFAIVAVPLIAPTIEAIRADRQAAARSAASAAPAAPAGADSADPARVE